MLQAKNQIFIILILGVLTSCAHIKNGYHVQRIDYKSYQDVADAYGVEVERLKLANKGEDFLNLKWVFIPRRVGFLGYWQLHNEDKIVEAQIEDSDNVTESDSSSKKTADVKGVDSKSKGLKLIWPVPSVPMISSRYGMRRGRMHHGIDIPSPMGTKIVASESGKVIYSASRISGYGKMTIIAHENDYLTVYAHNTKNLFKEGDYVKKGDVIALSGRTGRVTGPHLHFEVRKKDKSIDPFKFLKIPKKKRNIASSRKNSKRR